MSQWRDPTGCVYRRRWQRKDPSRPGCGCRCVATAPTLLRRSVITGVALTPESTRPQCALGLLKWCGPDLIDCKGKWCLVALSVSVVMLETSPGNHSAQRSLLQARRRWRQIALEHPQRLEVGGSKVGRFWSQNRVRHCRLMGAICRDDGDGVHEEGTERRAHASPSFRAIHFSCSYSLLPSLTRAR